ncbi:MAG: WYL domain-containing protein [Gammaproteobacteria bacterium]|nr:WYL domain-containing protein [Gammaproteobacteria bacterium]
MDRFDRIYDLHKLLSSSRYPVSREKIEQELECSRATAKRIIDNMRLYLDAPIKYDRSRNGYYYDGEQQALYELPGLWFNASELHALLSVQQLLTSVQPGLFEKQLHPLIGRIDRLLSIQHDTANNIYQRVRILQMASRTGSEFFQQVAGATIQRKKILIDYYNKGRDESESRTVSPQRLIHYRDNWYLDGWCHIREALRTFALDSVTKARILGENADEIEEQQLNDYFGSSYGIFSGKADKTAILVFSEKIARWVSREQWHPEQQGQFLDDGSFEMKIPFGNPTELIMDILRYGPDVTVKAPDSLRKSVQQRLQQALQQY